jgi:CubicO group peptidase (beta-lactamase class C family)
MVVLLLAAGANAGEIVEGKFGRDLDEFLLGREQKGLSAAFLVAKDGEIILRQGYGLADQKEMVPVTPETVFDIGSITKQFTAAAILKLEMQGKLSVTDSIVKYFKDVPDDKKGITLHHLLTHTAGLRDGFGGDYAPMTREQIIDKAMKTPLVYETGKRHQYSNAGYSLLGAIVEIVTDGSYEVYLREQFFEPLGMTQTGYRLVKWSPDRLARGYEKDLFGKTRDTGTALDHRWADDGPYWNLRANGGILSTVDDMYKWHLALLDNKILSDEAKAKLFKPHALEEEGGKAYYCYGWVRVKTSRDTTLITHNGGNGIFFADFRRYVDDDIVIIFMSNCAETFTSKSERGIRTVLFPS